MPNRLLDLPPLDLLRSFVAVGRRMSITLAGQDLCLTQSALQQPHDCLHAPHDRLGIDVHIDLLRLSFEAQPLIPVPNRRQERSRSDLV